MKVVHDVYLLTLLKNAIGNITINSIAGLSSVYHETPVICLDRAMYNIEGLTAEDLDLDGARSRNRTGTEFNLRRILSPVCLPISPPGHGNKQTVGIIYDRLVKFPKNYFY